MPEYGDNQYWEKRYLESKATTFDWLQDYAALKSLIEKICTRTSSILMLGCGNSLLSEEMYLDGYHNIYNIDISETCINQMKERTKNMEEMKWEVMDCTNLEYPDGFFDVVLDKSTIDALLCGNDPDLTVAKMTKEVQRVLKVDGIYCSISYGAPANRIPHLSLAHLAFEIEQSELAKPDIQSKNISTHYIYSCKKLPEADQKCQENFETVLKEVEFGKDHAQAAYLKYMSGMEKQLEELSVSKKSYLYADVAQEESDDDDFLSRLRGGSLDNEDLGKHLKNLKEQIEQVDEVVC